MTIEIGAAYVATGLLTLGVTGWSWWIKSKMDSISKLWEGQATIRDDFNSYKLHVAENYVNREILHEQLAPIHKLLESIQSELKELRKG